MGTRRQRLLILIVVLLSTPVLSTPGVLTAELLPDGGETQVNSSTTGNQGSSSVDMDGAGNFVVAWSNFNGSFGTDTDGSAIVAQRFQSNGSAIGDEFQVNSFTTGDQYGSVVAMNDSGAFVIAWETFDEPGDDLLGVRAQVYASDGSPVGAQITVNTFTTQVQNNPAVAVREDGEFIVTWDSGYSVGPDSVSVQGRRYGSDGLPIGSQIQINAFAPGTQSDPEVAWRPDGGFTAVWESAESDGADSAGFSIQLRHFNASGDAVGDQMEINSYTTGDQQNPDIAFDDEGAFVVVWNSFAASPGDDVDERSVQARRFASDSAPIGDDFQVNAYTTGRQSKPRVATRGLGEFLVTWQSYEAPNDDGSGARAAFFGSDGSLLGERFQVNTYTTEDQISPVVATDGGGRFAIVWNSRGSTGSDSDGNSVQIQRYEVIDVDGQVFFDADFNGLRDDGEAAIQDIDVHLYDATDGSLLASTTTNAEGAFIFPRRIGEYFLEFEAPTGYSFTFQDRGSDDSEDSDVDPSTGRTFTFISTEENTFDAGLTSGIGDFVWLDVDGDGIQGGSEAGAAGVGVQLFEHGGGEVASTMTGADGRYAFADLSPATYYLVFTAPSGFVFTANDQGSDERADSDADPVTGETTSFLFASGDIELDIDAGLESDGDLDGVADRVDNCPTDANADQADADGDGVGDICDVSSIGDRVWLDSNMNGLQDGGEAGFEGVTVELFGSSGVSQGTTLSAADGSYSFSGVASGDYYLAFYEPVGFCYTTRDQGHDDAIDSDVDPTTFTTPVFTLIEGGDDPSRDAGLVPDASIGNRVWLDDGNGIQDGSETGVENIVVHLYDDSDTLIGSTSTDTSGFYSFSPGPGDFYLEFDLPSDMAFAPRDRGLDDADSDASPSSGATILFSLGPGQVDSSRDAGLEPAVIGNRVWHDDNDDGRQQPGEPGQPGITVRLLDEFDTEIATTTTGAGGLYQFLGVATGTYRIEVTLPTDGVFSPRDVGGNSFDADLIDSDVDPSTGRSELFEYTAASANRRWDAGLRVLPLFEDGFESGDLSAWSEVTP